MEIKVGDPKAPFSIATTPWCKRGCNSIPWILHLTLDPHLIVLSAKQNGDTSCKKSSGKI